MLIELKIEISNSERSTRSRESFWSEFREKKGDGRPAPPPLVAEQEVRRVFPRLLEEHLNNYWYDDEDYSKSRDRLIDWVPKLRLRRRKTVRIRVRRISYGSMNLLLEAFGITNEALQNGILDELQNFSPFAFNQVFGTQVDLEATVDHPHELTRTGILPSASNKLWLLMNSSLLVPFAIAFYICYLTFNALMHELEGVRNESQNVRVERTEIVKALVDQNAKISAAIVESAKNSLTVIRALEESQSDRQKRNTQSKR